MLGISLLISTLSATLVSGNIYTTNPVASTIWTAGQSANVTWTDDHSAPALKDMGPISIELFANATNHVGTLATGVNPDVRSTVVQVSSSWGQTGADYHLRFVCKKPSLTVYSADFTIVSSSNGTANNGAVNNGPVNKASNSSVSSSTQATTSDGPRVLPLLTISLPDTTVTVAPTPSGMQPSGTGANSTFKTSSSVYYSSTDEAKSTPTQRTSSNNGVGRRFMDGCFGFHLVTVVWPLIIGLSMAL